MPSTIEQLRERDKKVKKGQGKAKTEVGKGFAAFRAMRAQAAEEATAAIKKKRNGG